MALMHPCRPARLAARGVALPVIALVIVVPILCGAGCASIAQKSCEAERVGTAVFPPYTERHTVAVHVSANAVNHKYGFGTPNASKSFKKREQEAIAVLGVPADGSATTIPPHFVIGKLVSSGAAAANWEGLLQIARERARNLGGDAIIITSYGVCPAMQTEYGTIVGDCLAAEVIRYGEAPPAP